MSTTKKIDPAVCTFGSENGRMRHHGVKFVCTGLGYTAFHCPNHICSGPNICCQRITDPLSFIRDFKPLCFLCDGRLQAEYYFPKIDSYTCRRHAQSKGDQEWMTSVHYRAEQLVQILFSGKEGVPAFLRPNSRQKERTVSKKSKKAKKAKKAKKKMLNLADPGVSAKLKKLKTKNKYGDNCQCRMTVGFGRKKKREVCKAWANYLCSERKAYVCQTHAHSLDNRECCRYISYDEGNRLPRESSIHPSLGVGVSPDVERSFSEEGADFDDGGMRGGEKEEAVTPCKVCKNEADYWCKKAQSWRCFTHMHTRWDCCDYAADSRSNDSGQVKKPLKEVQFVEA